jgi:predicted metal-dependent hydrolase
LGLWTHLSPVRLENELSKSTQLKKLWTRLKSKDDQEAKKQKSDPKLAKEQRLKTLQRGFLPSLLKDFIVFLKQFDPQTENDVQCI